MNIGDYPWEHKATETIDRLNDVRDNEKRMADSLEEIGKKLSHIEDWLGELVTYLKRK